MAVRVAMLPDGRLVIRQAGPVAARLFGLPFLAAGGWFLWQIASGIIDYMRAGAVAQLPSQIPGFLFLLVFAALFGVPGLLLTFGSNRVVIDGARGELLEVINWVVYRRATRRLLSEFASIDVLHEMGRHASMYNVYLGTGRNGVLAGVFDTPGEALDHAGAVSRATSLPVRDRTESTDEEE